MSYRNQPPVLYTCDGYYCLQPVHRQEVIIELIEEEEGGYSAICKNLPGACSQGETKAEAIANACEAFGAILEVYAEEGSPIPWDMDFLNSLSDDNLDVDRALETEVRGLLDAAQKIGTGENLSA